MLSHRFEGKARSVAGTDLIRNRVEVALREGRDAKGYEMGSQIRLDANGPWTRFDAWLVYLFPTVVEVPVALAPGLDDGEENQCGDAR
jgi:hypothetical protein